VAEAFQTPNPARPTSVTNGGSLSRSYEFVNGFTLGRTWEWERRWNYPSGFFRVTFKAGLGFGLRIPIRAHVTMTPGTIRVVDHRDQRSEYATSVRYETLDADSAFYSRAGMSQQQLFEGKELVLTAYVGYGYKFRALWTDWAHQPYVEHGIDYGQDFVPPHSANWQTIAPLFIPAELTRTAIDLGVLAGRIEAGVQLAARGRISGVFRSYVDGERVPTRFGNAESSEWRRDFTSSQQVLNFGASIPFLTSSASASRTYGYELGDLRYTSEWSVAPGVRVSVRAGVRGFSRTFNRTVWIEAARVEIGSHTFDTHAGTRRYAGEQVGRKYFENVYDQGGPG
jgi:hypothetical protein